MKKAKVFIQGRAFYNMTARTFTEHGGDKYEITRELDDSDIVVWTGGEDISPQLYGERPLGCTYYSESRDKQDLEAVREAVVKKKFLVGLCRGAQLLNVVPNGGSLWQDVDHHESCVHSAFDCVDGKFIEINSVHHQMMRPGPGAQMVCWASEASYKRSEKEHWQQSAAERRSEIVLEKNKDIEALYYPDTDSLLVQFHPEFGHEPTTRYFFYLMNRYYWGKDRISAEKEQLASAA